MTVPFSPKFRLTVGFAVLFFSLASSYLYTQSKRQLIQKPLITHSSVPQAENIAPNQRQFPSTASQIPLTHSSFQNNFLAQQPLQATIGKQNTRSSGQTPISEYQVIDESRKYRFSVNGSQIFNQVELPTTKVNFNQADLLSVITNTRKYFQDYSHKDPEILRTGLLGTSNVTVQDILKTLDFMITVLQEDIANQRATRLQDPNFINTHFRVIKWSAYNPDKIREKRLRITKYAVFTHPGSHTKTSTFNTPIYKLRDEFSANKFYTKYKKQDVLSGIYESGGREFGKVDVLAYLTRKGLEEALMEGTVLVNFKDGSALFNVDKSNEMPYIPGVAAARQKRYWYFRQVDDIKGYGYQINAKISIKPGVTFAGDVLNIGLGRIIVLEYMKGGRKHLQMGVVADTGGAFLPNLHQLDFLAGVFQNQKDFGQRIRQLPEYATAYILVKK